MAEAARARVAQLSNYRGGTSMTLPACSEVSNRRRNARRLFQWPPQTGRLAPRLDGIFPATCSDEQQQSALHGLVPRADHRGEEIGVDLDRRATQPLDRRLEIVDAEGLGKDGDARFGDQRWWKAAERKPGADQEARQEERAPLDALGELHQLRAVDHQRVGELPESQAARELVRLEDLGLRHQLREELTDARLAVAHPDQSGQSPILSATGYCHGH